MSSTTGLIFDVKRFAIHDGPGLRTTVFFKGCPLTCWICHNPEGQSVEPEILIREERCDLCGDCLPVCEPGAISLEGDSLTLDRARCDLCVACVEVCVAGALEITGREVTVEGLIQEVERDLLYYDESGGGVTLSGGEPLAQPDFLLAFLRRCEERSLPVVLDTAGQAPRAILEQVEPLVDLFLYDLKVMDGTRHQEVTGKPNSGVLENLAWLSEKGADVVVRIPLIPGVNGDEDNLKAMGSFLSGLPNPYPVDLLPYHRIGVDKYSRLGRSYKLEDTPPPTEEEIADAVAILGGFGLRVSVKGEAYGVE